MSQSKYRIRGTIAALMTPVVIGLAPVFGKQAIHAGVDPFTVAALRTCFAALLLWIVYGLFFRKYIYIFSAGLLGTMVVGIVNGLGSLLYYNGLLLLDNASLAQLLNMLYVIFVMLLVRLYGQQVSALSIVRAVLALIAVCLLALGQQSQGQIHWAGVGLMIGSAFLYALHVVLSQRAMYEMPGPTMALYALSWMGITALAARLLYGLFFPLSWSPVFPRGWLFILDLTLVTALSRVTLFIGVRSLGSLQTILLNVAEMGVTLLVAFVWLDERMELIQWLGVFVLVTSVLLSRWDGGLRDDVYRPLALPGSLHNLPMNFDEPLIPNRFSVVTRLYRRKPRSLSEAKK